MKLSNQNILLVLVIFFLLEPKIMMAQKENYFSYPLDSLPHYVSPFGSLRDNHFHSGADLSTRQQEGKWVFASANGYVSRIKIQSGGYGKALYIAHPNGKTTVYAHLQKYHGAIEEWIKKYQYQHKTYEFDYIFQKPLLYVKKNDTIAISGNSGTSTGPHLHFEIRDSETEYILNIAQFGLVQYDTIKPFLEQLNFYQFVPDGLILQQEIKINEKKMFMTPDSESIFIDTVFLEPETYGLGIVAFDMLNNNKNPTGIYSYSFWLNNQFKFNFALNQFSFDKSRYINTHIDYPYYKINGSRIQKAFLDDGNKISLYEYDKFKGKFEIKKDSVYVIKLRVEDNNKNFSIYKLIVKGKQIERFESKKKKYVSEIITKTAFYPGKEHVFELNQLKLILNEESIYDTMYADIEEIPKNNQSLTQIYRVQQYFMPVKKNYKIAIKIDDEKLLKYKSKLLIGYTDKEKNNFRSAGGHYDDGVVAATASNFGFFTVLMDTTAPSIDQIFVNKIKNKSDTLSWNFRITDNLSGIKTYHAYLNNNWILTEYDAKNNMLTYFFDEVLENQISIGNDKLTVKIIVSDNKGNTSQKEFIQTIPKHYLLKKEN